MWHGHNDNNHLISYRKIFKCFRAQYYFIAFNNIFIMIENYQNEQENSVIYRL